MKRILVIALLLSGCTGGQFARLRSLGTSAHVTCYSAGVKYYDGYSTGIVQSEEHSDGYYFNEQGTNDLVTVSGNCLIRHESR